MSKPWHWSCVVLVIDYSGTFGDGHSCIVHIIAFSYKGKVFTNRMMKLILGNIFIPSISANVLLGIPFARDTHSFKFRVVVLV